MRVLGIDPSSTFIGNATIDWPLGHIVKVEHWTRDKNRSHPQGFKDYFQWQMLRILIHKPQIAVIEMGAYQVSQGQGQGKGNFQAIQAVSFYQSIATLCCKLNDLIVIESRASSARKVTLGNGGLAKDKVWEIMRGRYPSLFSPKTRGGLDECDALVLAMAHERLSER